MPIYSATDENSELLRAENDIHKPECRCQSPTGPITDSERFLVALDMDLVFLRSHTDLMKARRDERAVDLTSLIIKEELVDNE